MPLKIPVSMRKRRTRVNRPEPGSSPGVIQVAEDSSKPAISVIAYGPDSISESAVESVRDLAGMKGRYPVLWVNVDGLGDAGTLYEIGEIFGLHSLALEDVVHVPQRPKVEEYDDHLFIVTRMVKSSTDAVTEQLGIFVGKDYLITFQQFPGDCLDPVRERLRKQKGRVRQMGPDYLAYAILDAVVDFYFPVLESYGEKLEEIESEVLEKASKDTPAGIHAIRHDLLSLRKSLWPMRELLNSLMRDETPLVRESTRVYLRDCHDHVLQLVDLVENYREMNSALMDLHLSSVSNRMNEVMKVLTMIATIFIPLGFIAGLYGMNFNPAASPFNMPELDWYFGYPFALGMMLIVTVGLIIYFRHKGWLSR